MKRIFLVAAVCLSVAAPAAASQADAPAAAPQSAQADEGPDGSVEDERQARLEMVEKALAVGDVDRAFRELSALYDGQEAAYRLGLRFESGKGVRRNQSRAWQWFKRAADRGHAEAQVKVAEYLAEGVGTIIDRRKALAYYRKAADQGHTGAQAKLGLWLLNGIGTDVNYVEAVRHLRAAAEAGEPLAVSALERLKEKGRPLRVEEHRPQPPLGREAQRVLDEVKDMLAVLREQGAGWIRIHSGSARIAEADDGYDVAVPDLRIEAGGNRVELGTLKLRFRPLPDGNYHVATRLPNAVLRDQQGAQIGSLSFRGARYSGTWLADSDIMADYDYRLQGMDLVVDRGAERLVARLSESAGARTAAKRADGLHDIREGGTGRGIILESDSPDSSFSISVGEFSLDGAYRGADLIRLERAGAEGTPWLLASGEMSPSELMESADVSLSLHDVAAQGHGAGSGPNGAGAELGALRLRLSGDMAQGESGRLDLEYHHQGLRLSGDPQVDTGLVPETMTIAIGLEGIPLDQRIGLVGLAAMQGDLGMAVQQAGMDLRVDAFDVVARDYALHAEGRLHGAAAGLEGGLTLRARGLDRLLAADAAAAPVPVPARDPAALLRQMRAHARQETDSQGRPVEVFEIAFEGGQTLVNGQPLPAGAR